MTPVFKTYRIVYKRELVEISSYKHFKCLSNGKRRNFLEWYDQDGLPKLLPISKYTSITPKFIVSL